MAGNRCVVYVEPGKVSVENIDYPKLELPEGVPGRNRKCEHGVILRIVATNICGCDQHMVHLKVKLWDMKSPVKSSNSVAMSSSSRKETSSQYRSISPVDDAGCAKLAIQGFVSTSILLAPERPMATSTWVVG